MLCYQCIVSLCGKCLTFIICDFMLHETRHYSVSDVWVPGARSTMFPSRRSITKLNETSSVGPLTWLVPIMCFNDHLASWKSRIFEGLCSQTCVLQLYNLFKKHSWFCRPTRSSLVEGSDLVMWTVALCGSVATL